MYVSQFKRNNISKDGKINENQHDRGDRSATVYAYSLGFDWCVLC